MSRGIANLLELIHSLTPYEKKAILQHLKQQKGKLNSAQYYLLKNIIQNQTNSEDQLKQDFQAQFPSIQYHYAKHLLYHTILNYLTFTQKTANPIIELQQIQILIEKSLYKDAHSKLIRLEKQLQQKEMFLILFHLLDLKITLSYRLFPLSIYRAHLQEIQHYSKFLIKAMQLHTFYRQRYNELFSFYSQYEWAKTPSENRWIENWFQSFQEQEQQLGTISSIRIQFMAHSVYGLFYLITQNYKKSAMAYKEALNLLNQHAWFIEENPNRLLSTYNNLIKSLFYLNHYEEINHLLSSMIEKKHLSSYSNETKLKLLENYYVLKSHYYFKTGKQEEVRAFLPEFHQFLYEIEKKATNLRIIPVLYFNCACLHYLIQNYPIALQWLNKAYNLGEQRLGETLYSFVLLLRIIIHYEIQSFDILLSLITNYEYYLEKKRALNPIEKDILSFFKKISQIRLSKQTLRKQFARLQSRLEKIKPQYLPLFDVFDLSQWLKAQLHNQHYFQVIQHPSQQASPN